MDGISNAQRDEIRGMVFRALADTKITDIHTHAYDPPFGGLLLWGLDELLTYHYLVAETFRWVDIPYDTFWSMPKREQADLVWKTVFLDHSPISESGRGVLAVLNALGLDVASRNLEEYRAFFDGYTAEDYIDRVFEIANIESVVMTNDPFDDIERQVWLAGFKRDPRFYAALRMDGLLNAWDTAVPKLNAWGYKVDKSFGGQTCAEVRRFLMDWIERIGALYMAVSLPPNFALPEDSPRGRLFEECIFPAARDAGIPVGLMIGVKKLSNPELRLAGDSVGKSSIDVVEHIARQYPDIKFLITMLARENQHELCVAARKFRNLHVFGCWWFLNSPSLVDEITRMRLEWLGLSVTPQHSDARVLDQVIYKWAHSLSIIGDALTDKYADIAATDWNVSEAEVRRDIAGLLGGNFWRFLGK
ncbi:MAG: glucuronate isomerase [Armatimonadetes bacterium]|nr:glucuronate isomerase [Armatimonadota bacterium]